MHDLMGETSEYGTRDKDRDGNTMSMQGGRSFRICPSIMVMCLTWQLLATFGKIQAPVFFGTVSRDPSEAQLTLNLITPGFFEKMD